MRAKLSKRLGPFGVCLMAAAIPTDTHSLWASGSIILQGLKDIGSCQGSQINSWDSVSEYFKYLHQYFNNKTHTS